MKPGTFGHLVTVILVCTLTHAGVATAQPPVWPPLRPVADAPGQFRALKHHGEWLAFYAPDLDLTGSSHWQGLQRFNGPGRPYLFVTASGNASDDTRASLAVVEMASRDESGERLRSNRLRRDHSTEETAPPNEDRVVALIRFGEYQHAGGIQLMGHILAVPLEEKRDDSLPEGKVLFFDVSDPRQPQQIGALELDFKAGVVGMTDLPGGRVLLAVTGGDGRSIRFFRSDVPFGAPGFEFDPLMVWDGRTQLENGLWPWQTDADVDGALKVVSTHQTLNFVRQIDGRLFLIGTHNTHNHSPVIRGDDVAVLYEVLNSDADVPIRIREIDGLHFSCAADEAGRSCNFNGGAGIYVSPTGELILYAMEHYADGPNQTVQFAEYRHVDVFRPDNPRYFPSVDVGGPYDVNEGSAITLTGGGGPPSARAWVELYHDAPAGWRPQRARMTNALGGMTAWSFEDVGIDRSIVVDHGDAGRDDFEHLDALDGFNDKASSVRWWAPPGCSIFLIESSPPGPRHLRLGHTPPGLGFIPDLDAAAMCDAEGDCVNAGDETSAVAFNVGCDMPQYAAPVFEWSGEVPPDVARLRDRQAPDARLDAFDGPFEQMLRLEVCLSTGACARRPALVRIHNVAPVISDASVTADAARLARLQVAFVDASRNDVHDASADWGDGTSGDVMLSEHDGKGTVDVSHTYERPGTYRVTVTIADDDGGTASEVLFVTVSDMEAPILSLPDDITKEALGPDGTAAAYAASAFDEVDGEVAVTCVPAAGAVFALGATIVTCDAADTSGNLASGSFTVKVVDTTPPALMLPGALHVEAGGREARPSRSMPAPWIS